MKKYDYGTDIFGFDFPESRESKEKEKADWHPIDESSWQTENFPK
jgi:hypothetical protein